MRVKFFNATSSKLGFKDPKDPTRGGTLENKNIKHNINRKIRRLLVKLESNIKDQDLYVYDLIF